MRAAYVCNAMSCLSRPPPGVVMGLSVLLPLYCHFYTYRLVCVCVCVRTLWRMCAHACACTRAPHTCMWRCRRFACVTRHLLNFNQLCHVSNTLLQRTDTDTRPPADHRARQTNTEHTRTHTRKNRKQFCVCRPALARLAPLRP